MYVGLENADAIATIDTSTNRVVAEIPVGQAPQAVVYVPKAVKGGDPVVGLQPLGLAGKAVQLSLEAVGSTPRSTAPTSVSLFEQGLIQVLQAGVSGLEPGKPYVLGLAERPDGSGRIEPLANFKANPAGSAVVNALGPIRQVVSGNAGEQSRYLVIVPGTASEHGPPVQVQSQIQ
jgi:YVTN family beta-propeller protein